MVKWIQRIFGVEAKQADAADADIGGLTSSISMGESGSVDHECKPGRHYVYVHKDEGGSVFYVGKGTDKRAWSTDRDPVWREHVAQLGGRYTVEIVREGMGAFSAVCLKIRALRPCCQPM